MGQINETMKIKFTGIGALLAGIAVALGAFGAHFLKANLPVENAVDYVESFKTGVQYQMYHGLALILIGILNRTKPSKKLENSAIAFLLGIVFFCGSLYMITLGRLAHFDLRWMGAITPIGGISFMAGWGLVAWNHLSR